MSPIPSATAQAVVHPKAIPSLIKDGRFPDRATLQSNQITQSPIGGVSYQWQDVRGLVDIPCLAYNELLRQLRAALAEVRTPEMIEELTYWDVLLSGYYPEIDPSWRVNITTLDKVLDIVLVSSDSLKMYTMLTCREFEPVAEAGV